MQQVLRNTAMHLAGRIAPVRHLLAEQMEETDLGVPAQPDRRRPGPTRRGPAR